VAEVQGNFLQLLQLLQRVDDGDGAVIADKDSHWMTAESQGDFLQLLQVLKGAADGDDTVISHSRVAEVQGNFLELPLALQ